MTLRLEGSCRCGAIAFAVGSHAPAPYMLCYCSVCRKTGGGGGYAINLSAVAPTLEVTGAEAVRKVSFVIDGETSPAERSFCGLCGTALWVWDPRWPGLLHPFASAIDSALPVPPHRVHIMLDFKPDWVIPDIRPGDRTHPRYPDQSIEEWHREANLWID
jgi:hypothetical protein